MRRAPVEVEIDTVSVLRLGIFEIVRKPGNRREFVSGRRVEISIAASGVDRPIADAEILKPPRIVAGGRNVAGDICQIKLLTP